LIESELHLVLASVATGEQRQLESTVSRLVTLLRSERILDQLQPVHHQPLQRQVPQLLQPRKEYVVAFKSVQEVQTISQA
jgi:hypothetical protein